MSSPPSQPDAAPTNDLVPGRFWSRHHRLFLWLYGGLFFFLMVLFARATAPFLPYDEIGHMAYVDSLRLGRGFPLMTNAHKLGLKSDPRHETHEAHQPPVYYALLAPAGYFFRVADPWKPDGPGLLALRLWGVLLFGGLFAFFCYRLYALCLPPPLAVQVWGATLLLHTLIASFATVNNDAGVVAFGAMFLYFLARGDSHWKWACLAAGFSFGSKAFFVFLLPAVVLSEILALPRRGVWPTISRGLWLLGALMLGGGWYFLRNQWLYGHPFATPLVKTIIPASRLNPADPAQLLIFLKDFANNFWNAGLFVRGAGGAMSPVFSLIAGGVVGVGVALGGGVTLRAGQWLKTPLGAISVLGAPLGLLMIFLNSLDIYAPSGRYLLVVIPALWLCLGKVYERWPLWLLRGLVVLNALSATGFVYFVWRYLWAFRNEPGFFFGGWSFAGLWPG